MSVSFEAPIPALFTTFPNIMSNHASFSNPSPDSWEPRRQGRHMAPRNLIGYVSPVYQPDRAALKTFTHISEKFNALGEHDNRNRDLPFPEFEIWCTPSRHKLTSSGSGRSFTAYQGRRCTSFTGVERWFPLSSNPSHFIYDVFFFLYHRCRCSKLTRAERVWTIHFFWMTELRCCCTTCAVKKRIRRDFKQPEFWAAPETVSFAIVTSLLIRGKKSTICLELDDWTCFQFAVPQNFSEVRRRAPLHRIGTASMPFAHSSRFKMSFAVVSTA